jgi:hypothetical protein
MFLRDGEIVMHYHMLAIRAIKNDPVMSTVYFRTFRSMQEFFFVKISPVLWSRSWSRKEPELLAGAGAGILKFRLRLLAPAPGQTKVVYLIIFSIE